MHAFGKRVALEEMDGGEMRIQMMGRGEQYNGGVGAVVLMMKC